MKCVVCKKEIPKGKGKVLVKNDGKILYFCSSKCQRNWEMGRAKKGLKWASI